MAISGGLLEFTSRFKQKIRMRLLVLKLLSNHFLSQRLQGSRVLVFHTAKSFPEPQNLVLHSAAQKRLHSVLQTSRVECLKILVGQWAEISAHKYQAQLVTSGNIV